MSLGMTHLLPTTLLWPTGLSYADEGEEERYGRARRRMIVLAILAYAAWFVYTRNAKHSAPVWGHRYAKPQSREKWAVLFFISLVLARGSGAPTAHLLSSAVRRWAARIAAAVCRLIGLVCGLTFAVKFEDEAGLQAEHRGLVAAVGPHGVFPLAMLGFGAFKFRRDCGFGEPGLTELNARFAGASVCFLVPVIRELLLLMGVRDANRSTLKRLLASNHSVAIQPGGIWEMVMSDSRQVCDGHTIPHPLSPWAARSLPSSHSLLRLLSRLAGGPLLPALARLRAPRDRDGKAAPPLLLVWREPALQIVGRARAATLGRAQAAHRPPILPGTLGAATLPIAATDRRDLCRRTTGALRTPTLTPSHAQSSHPLALA